MNAVLASRVVSTPLGPLVLAATGEALVSIRFDDAADPDRGPVMTNPALDRAAAWIDRYFEGPAPAFDVPLASAGTPFQRGVWRMLASIEPGTTITYADAARRLGLPTHVRAVAAAIARNPWAIAVPCHRVVGQRGALTGYAYGIARKRALLELEARGAVARRAA